MDKIELAGLTQLQQLGIQVADGQEVMEMARAIKNEDEINAMRCSICPGPFQY